MLSIELELAWNSVKCKESTFQNANDITLYIYYKWYFPLHEPPLQAYSIPTPKL